MERIQTNGWRLVSHSPYSVDLAPSDYNLLMVIKDQIRGQHNATTKPSIVIYELLKNYATSKLYVVIYEMLKQISTARGYSNF